MAKTMIASEQMIDGQIENLVAKFRDAVRKHRSEFPKDAVQKVLGVENLGMELLEPFRKRVEADSSLIIRCVKVNLTRNGQEALDATGRRQYTDRMVVNSMPKGEGDEVNLVFFKPDLSKRSGLISDDNLEKEYKLRGLKPADPYSVAAHNEVDPAFADEKPHGTHWKGADGKWYCAYFRRWNVRRSVGVHRVKDWSDYWYFAGVPA